MHTGHDGLPKGMGGEVAHQNYVLSGMQLELVSLISSISRKLCCRHCKVTGSLQETEPMGTAGPLRLASDILDDGSGDPFFVLNR